MNPDRIADSLLMKCWLVSLSKIWRLTRELSDAQRDIFGFRVFEGNTAEAKAKRLLKTKTFRLAGQMDRIDPQRRTGLVKTFLEEDGQNPTKEKLTALGQAKIDYCFKAIDLCRSHGAVVFASVVPTDVPRPSGGMLRKDYAYLFERYFYFLNAKKKDPMGYLVFDELDRSASHVLLGQVSSYFIKTKKGRARARLVIPEPLFVHSDLTALVQMADLVAYTISWGLRLKGMTKPKRTELSELAERVRRLQFRNETEGGQVHYGIKYIKDLRPKPIS